MGLANRLLDNPPGAPVLECLAGARFRVLTDTPVALAGFGHARGWLARAGELIELTPALPGVWHSLALPGGVRAPRWLGSASVCRRAAIGAALTKGSSVAGLSETRNDWPQGVAARYPAETSQRDAGPIRVWPGPQWRSFSPAARRQFLAVAWQVSTRSDRVGYRLAGSALTVPQVSLTSEPVRLGTIQIPPDGQPIVCLNDGPTVGGYAKIAVIDPTDRRRLVQTQPGETVTFMLIAP